MRDKITKPIHDAMVVMRSEGYSLCEIAEIFSISHASVIFDLTGKRKTPYRPSNETTVAILQSALSACQREITHRGEILANALRTNSSIIELK